MNRGWFPLCLVISVIFITISLKASADPTEDVVGWSKVKWGMTEAEVSAAFPGQVVPSESNGNNCSNKIDGTEIIDNQFIVTFEFDCSSKKLKDVIISPKYEIAGIEAVSLFDKLLDELKIKYGPPTKVEDNIFMKNRIWLFPSTKIDLLFAPSDDSALLRLVYKQKKKEDML